MKYYTLRNGVEIPAIGFGVFQVPDYQECKKSVLWALESGYRLIDTAAVYINENAVGEAIKESGINRDEIFVTTKLWIQDQGYEKAKLAFGESLNRLQLDYLDLYLIHQPLGDYYGSWRALEELYKNGKIRAIGVSNFYPDRLVDLIIHNKIAPAVNQVEMHPFSQQVTDCEIMREYDVQPESWGPFAEGKNGIFENEILKDIGKQHEKSVAQVILRWLIQRDVVAIPKSVHQERIRENIDVFDFQLTDENMEVISTIDTKKNLIRDHRNPETIKLWTSIRYDA